MFDWTLWFLLPMILFLGIITSFEDIKRGKIRNKWIIIAAAYAVVVNIGLFAGITIITGQMPRIGYFAEQLIMAILSLLLGFILWHAGIWTAGDAKLFAAFSALVPLSIYSYGYIPYLSSINILINTMVPLFIIYIPLLLIRTTWAQKLAHLRRAFSPGQLLQVFLFLYALVWPIRLLFQLTGIAINTYHLLFLLVILTYAAQKYTGMKLAYLAAIIAVFRMLFDPAAFQLAGLQLLLITLFALTFLRFFLIYCAYDVLTKQMDLNLVEKGMVPAERVYMEKGKYRKEEVIDAGGSMKTPSSRKYLYEITAEGLGSKDVEKIRRLKFEHLRIYQILPFAPYLFAGVILTMVFQGNMFLGIVALL